MAPRTRSNRGEIVEKQRILASGGRLNSKGLPALPDELYLEIASYIPTRIVPTLDEKVDADSEAPRYRHFTLSALSQTCRTLRRFFLRCLWQRIEVFDGMETGNGPLLSTRGRYMGGMLYPPIKRIRGDRYAKELIRQLEIVTVRNPDLAQYVKSVSCF